MMTVHAPMVVVMVVVRGDGDEYELVIVIIKSILIIHLGHSYTGDFLPDPTYQRVCIRQRGSFEPNVTK